MPKYYNIALVGHVANGKTTLVERLTNVNTKRYSTEKKYGRTIKLGYANCLVWICPICQTIMTTGQKEKWKCCDFDLEPEQYLSIVDCPGHHEYINNMVKGTAIIDAAILVTDVRKDKLQIQTLEHLAILEILNVKHIIVVQNKVDLVNQEQCIKHYNMLQQELKNTVAEQAPIIPCSAQSGKNIEKVREYLYYMVNGLKDIVHNNKYKAFSIIRSFDINKPYSDIQDLKGGVLGGTVIGNNNEYKVGEKIEIRPGIYNRDGTYRPLMTEILTIFSETKKCDRMNEGGLYGIGTKLDPVLTKDDRIVGMLAGRPDELPPIRKELGMTIHRMKVGFSGETLPKIENNQDYQLIIGSNVIQGKYNKKEKKMILVRPVCILDSRCLLYTKDFSHLLGYGVMDDIVHIEEQKGIRMNFNYTQVLPDLVKPEKVRVHLPEPKMMRDNRNMIWSNMSMFCTTINRQPDHVITYVQNELCIETTQCQVGLKIIKAKITPLKLQKVLQKYILEKVQCEQCKCIQTEVRHNSSMRHDMVVCMQCGSTNRKI